RRRGDLHWRPFLHPAVGLPVAHRQAESRSAAQRSGDDRDRQLRRLRAVWRGRPCGRAVSVVLSRRADPESELVGPRRGGMAPTRHLVAWRLPTRRRRCNTAVGAGDARPPERRRFATVSTRKCPERPPERRGLSLRPVTLLIGALGGEGGGVLTDWIVAAATRGDLPVQSTSIPGVAQRTGTTTYYIEDFPQTWRDLGGKRPVLALAPGSGDVDMVVASEFLEVGRAVAGGFVTPDRTLVIASTHRFHAIAEKVAMGDGRFDTAKLTGA